MKITLISGSHRPNSQSLKVAKYLEQRAIDLGFESKTIDLAQENLPMWNEGVWQKTQQWQEVWGNISKELQSSDAFAIISPEWAGMAPPAMKNFLLLCSSEEVGYKPAVLVGVSASIGGAYPIAELKNSGIKNNHMIYTPEHLIVRNVNQVFENAEPSDQHEQNLRERVVYSLSVLKEMAEALGKVRSSGVLNYEKYPFGM